MASRARRGDFGLRGGGGGEAEEGEEAGGVGGGSLGDEAAGVGEVDVGLGGDAGEVELGVVAKPGEAVAGTAAVGVDEADHVVGETEGGEVAVESGRRIVKQGLGAGKEEEVARVGVGIEGPALGVLGDEVEAGAQVAHVAEQVGPDQAHDFPERLAGVEAGGLGEGAEEGAVEGGVELVDGGARHAEAAGGFVGAEAIEPLGGLEPVAESAGVVVEAEVLEDEGEGAEGRVVGGELVVIEVEAFGLVAVADIDHRDGGILEVGLGGFAAEEGDGVFGEEHAAGEEFIFVGTTRVGEEEGEMGHVRVSLVGVAAQGNPGNAVLVGGRGERAWGLKAKEGAALQPEAEWCGVEAL